MTRPCSRGWSEDHSTRRSTAHAEPPTSTSPPPLDEGVVDQRSAEQWGNIMGKKQTTTLRIAFQNIGGFLKDEEMEVKLETLRRFITDHNIDIFGFTEANKCWDLVPEAQRLPMKTWGWWETSHWSLAPNHTEANTGTQQPGGTGLLCVNQVAHWTLRPGDDLSGLGCWSWIRLRGPGGFFLRVVVMYRPCFSNGSLTTYQQHIRRLATLSRVDCPREVILIDLAKEIQQWQDDGDHVLLLTDYNDDIGSSPVCSWAGKLGLVEAVTWLNNMDAPPTFCRGS